MTVILLLLKTKHSYIGIKHLKNVKRNTKRTVYVGLLIHSTLVLTFSKTCLAMKLLYQHIRIRKKHFRFWFQHERAHGTAVILAFYKTCIEKVFFYQHIRIRKEHLNRHSSDFSTSAPMVMLCGNQVPEPYISESPHVTVRFVSDILFQYRGFKITVFHAARKGIAC